MNIFKITQGQGEDIVVLHGWGCTHQHMKPIVDALSKRYRITNLDLPGRGQSKWDSNNQTIHDIADQLIAELPNQAIYIGWSFSGLISISLAARYPERVKRFIGITTTPKFVTEDDWPGIAKPGFSAGFKGVKEIGFQDFFKAFYDSEFANSHPKPSAYYELIEFLLDDSKKVDLDILLKGITICDATDLREQYKLLQCPIDLILGEKDDAVPSSSHEKIQELNPKAKIHVISKASHLPFWTHPKEFGALLNSLL